MKNQDRWICHACGESRPDRKIGVAKEEGITKRGIKITVTQRFCTDTEHCMVIAHSKALKLVESLMNPVEALGDDMQFPQDT